MLIYIQMIESPEARSKFEDLYLHYRGLMLYVAARIVGGGADAEDAVHQAFLSIAENMDRLGAVKSAETHAYVVTITENKAIDILRSRREVPTDLQQEDGLTVPPPGDHGLADAMAKLRPTHRTALLLRYYNGYTTAEMAKILDMRIGAVQKLLWRAKQELKKQLEEEV